jgi:hypothetical protein
VVAYLRRSSFIAPAIALSLLSAWNAGAQPRPPAASPPESTSAPSTGAGAEAAAREHFKKGNAHFDRQEWPEALGEFREALALKRTRAALLNEASCLRQLGRYDEALDAYEALRREFPALLPRLEAQVAPAIAELQGLVGTLVVRSEAPAGAALFVDDRRRGTLPQATPLRLSVGSHAVRVESEGFEPMAGSVEIKPGRENAVELEAKSRQGLLRVSEKHNLVLDVEVDGTVVGQTPWEGRLPVGDHQVRVHGFVPQEAPDEDDAAAPASATAPDHTEMGSITSTVAVRLYEATTLAMAARDLDSSLRVDATPAEAAVIIDGKVVGNGTWEGRLPLGTHTVEITAGGFLPATQEVRLVRRKQPQIRVALGRTPKLGIWGPRRNAAVGVAYALGAAGLTVSAVTGADALVIMNGVLGHCMGTRCPTPQRAAATRATSLATASTAGLVVGGTGLVAGTLLVAFYRPHDPRADKDERPRPPRVAWNVGVGLGRLELGGRF